MCRWSYPDEQRTAKLVFPRITSGMVVLNFANTAKIVSDSLNQLLPHLETILSRASNSN